MLSEYFITSQNASTINAAIIIHIIIPHQVVKGINSKEYDVVATDTARVIKIITTKYPAVMEDRPATKHNTSSGNIGKRNMTDKIR